MCNGISDHIVFADRAADQKSGHEYSKRCSDESAKKKASWFLGSTIGSLLLLLFRLCRDAGIDRWRRMRIVRIRPGETVFRYLHIAKKAIPNRGNGGDVARLVSVISKHPTQQRDARVREFSDTEISFQTASSS
jgi:hypothetical protein